MMKKSQQTRTNSFIPISSFSSCALFSLKSFQHSHFSLYFSLSHTSCPSYSRIGFDYSKTLGSRRSAPGLALSLSVPRFHASVLVDSKVKVKD